jgi:hypothetical protein
VKLKNTIIENMQKTSYGIDLIYDIIVKYGYNDSIDEEEIV